MKCPVDNAVLLISERNGIEIDYCPECRGVWLDRGELDKIIERTSSDEPSQSPRQTYHPEPRPRHDDRDSERYHHKKRKESFLGDLFDF